jgi:hypothetical protein
MKDFQNNRKQEEKSFLTCFSKAYAEFPKGKIKDSESPDFIISLSNKRKLGIELTRLTQPNSENSEFNVSQIDSLEKRICKEAQKIFESGNDIPLYLSIFFHDNIRVTNNEIIDIAEKIAVDIRNHSMEIDRKSIFQIQIQNPIAKDHVDLIQSIYHPNVTTSYWGITGGYFVPPLSKEYLTERIKSKEHKLPLYKKKRLNELWLIIVADTFERSTSFNIDNQIEAWNIGSRFDKVFLFEVMAHNVYVIK